MKEGECITKKELRWDLIDLEAPLYICDGAEKTDSESEPRNPAAATVATSHSHRSGGDFDIGADRFHLARC